MFCQLSDADLLTWNSQSSENMHMLVDEDYMGLMSDTLFSTITNQPFAFPDSREIGTNCLLILQAILMCFVVLPSESRASSRFYSTKLRTSTTKSWRLHGHFWASARFYLFEFKCLLFVWIYFIITEFMAYKLPTVPEEQLQNTNWNYSYLEFLASTSTATGNNLQVCVY